MSETPATAAAKIAAKAATKPIVENVVTDHLNTILPTVVATSEMAMEVPSKIVVNQRAIVFVGVLGGVLLGAGVVYGIDKFRASRAKKKIEKAAEAISNA